MDFSLSDEQKLLRGEAREFLGAEWPSSRMRRMLDEPHDAGAELWKKIAQLGWPGLLIAEDSDGLGLGMFDLAVLMEEMGRRLLPGTFFASGVMAALALQHLGHDTARWRHLPNIAAGSVKAALGVYEPESGWDLSALTVFDRSDDRTCVKSFVMDAAAAELLLCVVRTPRGFRLVVPRDPEILPSQPLDATRPLAEVRFHLGDAEVMGQPDLPQLEHVIDLATVALAAEMVGEAAELLDMTVSYVKARTQFGRPVGSFQAVQHRAADILIELEKARSAAYYAAMVADQSPADLPLAASLAKAAANQALRFAAQQAIQLHGGIGFTWEQDLHLYFKRAKSCEFTFGNTAWHLERIAGAIGL